MSKFNKNRTVKTVNKCGHAAYAMGEKEKLVSQTLTTFFGEPKFYGDNSSELVGDAGRLAASEPKFVANLARYARKEMHLRSVAHVLTCIVAHEVAAKPYIKEVVADVVERADDITEILSFYLGVFGKPIPNGLKKALGDALCRFDEYQVGKYSGGKKDVTFLDVLRLTHVRPKNEKQEKLFSDIVNGTLQKAERWETELSSRGNTREVWEELIAGGKLGYMAMLRNLRNILAARPDNLDVVLDTLADRDRVLKSKQLPMRFYAAAREVSEMPECSSRVLDALEKAVSYSTENLPRLAGKTVIAVDVSGSMSFPVSARSKTRCCDIANLLAVIAGKMCEDFVVFTFDTELSVATFPSGSGIIATASHIENPGGGTDIKLPIRKMIDDDIAADRLIIFSDNEINYSINYCGKWKTCQTLIDEYRRKYPGLWVHAVDLQGYGTQQFIGPRTDIICGWSDSVLSFISLAEQGLDSQVKAIEEYDVGRAAVAE